MSWVNYNANPDNNLDGDCVIRALSLALNQDWEQVYAGVMAKGFSMHRMPSTNAVWIAYLRSKGFNRYIIPNECPECYTIKDFANDHPTGIYILGTGTHVVTVKDGKYYDTWDSGDEIPEYYLIKEN